MQFLMGSNQNELSQIRVIISHPNEFPKCVFIIYIIPDDIISAKKYKCIWV